MNEGTISLSVLMKDLASSKLKLLQGKSDSFFNNWKAKINKAEAENKEFKMSISQINTELDRLTKLRKITVDKSSLKSLSKEMDELQAEKMRMENFGVTDEKTSLKKGLGSLGKMGLVGAGIGAIYSAGRFMSSSIDEFNSSAQVQAQLKASLLSTKGASGKTLSDLQEQSSALQNTTLFEDDETAAAQKILLTFTNVKNAVYDEAVPAIQDMATKMDMDLSSAAISVGKALQDPIVGVTALRRQGVMLTETQEEQIKQFVKLGQVEKAQAVILKELNKEFGGSAAAAAKAGTGAFTILANKAKDFKEVIGERLTSKLGGLSKSLIKIVETATKWVEVPIEEKLQKEQIEINNSLIAISELNEGSDERIQKLNELKNEYPDYLANLNAENSTNKDLLATLNQINNAYSIKIANAKDSEKIKGNKDELTDDFDALTDLNKKINEVILKYKSIIDEQIPEIAGKMDNFLLPKDKLSVLRKGLGENYASFGGTFTPLLKDLYKLEKEEELYNNKVKDSQAKNLKIAEDQVIKNQAYYGDLSQMDDEMIELALKSKNSQIYLAAHQEHLLRGQSNYTPPPKNTSSGIDPEGLSTVNGDISKVKNINITINRLIGIEQLTSNTAIESLSSMEDAVKKVLLTAVNDSNMAGN